MILVDYNFGANGFLQFLHFRLAFNARNKYTGTGAQSLSFSFSLSLFSKEFFNAPRINFIFVSYGNTGCENSD